jgi:DNA replication and repair protein RecF
MSATAAGLLSLDIEDFRNISHASLSFSPEVNLITGPNAAGKTSLLEAVYCLGRVRSFRTADANRLIREGQSRYRLLGRLGLGGGRVIPIGLERREGQHRIRLDGQTVQRLSQVAGCFSVQIMSGDTTSFLNGGPGYRRQSVDWALFHVEQGYRDMWQRCARALRQRNAALRAQSTAVEISAWDNELTEAAISLDRLRRDYLAELEPYVQHELAGLLPGRVLALRYGSGWPRSISLQEALKRNLEKDLALGYTHYGPHRADIALLVDGGLVHTNFSRGQRKTILLAFLVGQVKMQRARRARGGAFLLDDLGSELDPEHQSRILECLMELGSQVLVTAIDTRAIRATTCLVAKRFHVEHGGIEEVL